jgi:hypothetical protein
MATAKSRKKKTATPKTQQQQKKNNNNNTRTTPLKDTANTLKNKLFSPPSSIQEMTKDLWQANTEDWRVSAGMDY